MPVLLLNKATLPTTGRTHLLQRFWKRCVIFQPLILILSSPQSYKQDWWQLFKICSKRYHVKLENYDISLYFFRLTVINLTVCQLLECHYFAFKVLATDLLFFLKKMWNFGKIMAWNELQKRDLWWIEKEIMEMLDNTRLSRFLLWLKLKCAWFE